MKKAFLPFLLSFIAFAAAAQNLEFYNFRNAKQIENVITAVTYVGHKKMPEGWEFGRRSDKGYVLDTFFVITTYEKNLVGKTKHIVVYAINNDGVNLKLEPRLFAKKGSLDPNYTFPGTYTGKQSVYNARIDTVRRYVEYFMNNEPELEATVAMAKAAEQAEKTERAAIAAEAEDRLAATRPSTNITGFTNSQQQKLALAAVVNAMNQEGFRTEFGRDSTTLFYQFNGMGYNLVVYKMTKTADGLRFTDVEHSLGEKPGSSNSILRKSDYKANYVVSNLSLDNPKKKSGIFLEKLKAKMEFFRDDKDFNLGVQKKEADELNKRNEQQTRMAAFHQELSRSCKTWSEGNQVCLFDYTDGATNSAPKVQAFVEKYNSEKTRLQLRIHQVNGESSNYDNLDFKKGDIIWINLPSYAGNQYWNVCK